jgi:hypothetical protein
MAMKINWKKILAIIAFILVVAVMGYAIYYVFFKAKAPVVVVVTPPEFPGGLVPGAPGVPGVPPEVVPPSVLPPSPGIFIPSVPAPTVPTITTQAAGGLVVPQKIVYADGQFVSLSSSGNSINYYDNSTGLFNRVNPDGSISLLSSQVFKDVKNVTWAANTDKSVIVFADDSKIIYNFTTKESFTLPKQFTDFSFSPDSKQLAAKDLKINAEDRWLVLVDDHGRNKELLEHLGNNDNRVVVQWNPAGNIVATTAKSIDNGRAEVIFLTKDGSKPNKLLIQGRDLRYQYSADGNRMAYSVWNQDSSYQPLLWITSSNPNTVDQGRVNTGLKTWADKCAFQNNDAVYCAVPRTLSEFAGIDPTTNDSVDDIYRVDPYTGQSTLIAQPIFPVSIGSVSVTKDGKSLFYTKKETGSINKIEL